MKDLRKSMNVNPKDEKKFSFKPFKWVRSNWKNILTLLILFIILNLLFNPGGVSKFISSWVSEFNSNWNL